jgi:hypothetical protein
MRNTTFIKTDCFGYREEAKGAECTALKKLYCKKGVCPFYKDKQIAKMLRDLAEIRARRKGYGEYILKCKLKECKK